MSFSKVYSFIKQIGQTTAARSFFLGSLLAFALPPFYVFPLALYSLTKILKLHDECKDGKSSALLGWWFGFGYFTIGLHWICFALTIDIAQFGWLIPFALFGISAVIALYIAVVFYGLFLFKVSHLRKVIIFALVWTVVEILRGSLFTGFPWNLVGYIWNFSTNMIQITSVVGIWGLSFLTILICAMPYCLSIKDKSNKLLVILWLGLLICLYSFGQIRLSLAKNDYVDGINLRLVQANIEQSFKWDSSMEYKNLMKHINLSLKQSNIAPTHIIWPETAIPYIMENNPPIKDSILSKVIPQQGALMAGVVKVEKDNFGMIKNIWNSMLIADSKGRAEFYDKSHLVPFGEYVPLREYLPFAINKITNGMVDFSRGEGRKTIRLDGFVPFSPLICYEAIFPHEVINNKDYPQAIVNITNDAWYGYSAGPFQHFEMVRIRAVEQGIPVIRAANTGISGVIDPYGRVVAQSKLLEETVVDAKLPKSLANKTVYASLGHWVVLLILFGSLVIALIESKFSRVSINRMLLKK